MPAEKPDALKSGLRAVLGAEEPSAGFAARVARRAVNPPPRREVLIPRWIWAVAVLFLAAAVVLGVWRRQQRRETAAAQQLQTALTFTNAQISHITDVALRHAIQSFDQETP